MREKLMAWSIEWEGSISVNRSTRNRKRGSWIYQSYVAIGNTREELINAFFSLVGYGKVSHYKSYVNNCKDTHKWEVKSYSDIKKFCEEVLPFLITKKKQAQLAIEFCNLRMSASRDGICFKKGENTRTPREKEIYEEMKKLNSRGMETRKDNFPEMVPVKLIKEKVEDIR